jgi:hypothetical protein
MFLPIVTLRYGFDTYERHRLVSSFIDLKLFSILDVGGSPELLNKFIDHPVTVTNINTGDVISNGLFLPFKSGSFDIVTSLDVLEHLQRHHRAQFIAELFRVAKLRVIFCTPLGSLDHIQREKELLTLITRRGTKDIMLEEHVTFGIPTLQELEEYIPVGLRSQIVYSGDFRYNVFLFTIDQSLVRMNAPKVIRIFFSLPLNIIGNILIYPLNLSKKSRKFTNRVTAVIIKSSIGS